MHTTSKINRLIRKEKNHTRNPLWSCGNCFTSTHSGILPAHISQHKHIHVFMLRKRVCCFCWHRWVKRVQRTQRRCGTAWVSPLSIQGWGQIPSGDQNKPVNSSRSSHHKALEAGARTQLTESGLNMMKLNFSSFS